MPTQTIVNTSNTVATTIQYAQISNVDGGLVKSLDLLFADVGDIITYTILLKNTGNTSANNIVFTDPIPNVTVLIQNSVMLNGITQAGADPRNGITIGTLGPGAMAKVEFKVKVETIPNPNVIKNTGYVDYSYTSDPANPNANNEQNATNTVETIINSGKLSNVSKTASLDFADIGDEITYTIVASNVGNVTLNELVIKDTIPNGTTFINNTISINGITQLGNPTTGIEVGSIAVGDTITATFKVAVITIPSPNPIANTAVANYLFTVDPAKPNGRKGQKISNEANTKVNSAKLNLVKSAKPLYSDVQDVVTYTIEVKNTGNIEAQNVLVSDTIPRGVTLVGNSVTINGVPQIGINPETGVYIGSIAAGTVATLAFKGTVNTVPSPNRIPNQAIASYTYISNPNNPNNGIYTEASNTTVNIINHGDILTKKYVDKCYASVDDIIVYTLGLTNIGNVSLNNVVINDTIPKGTTIIPGSITVNGISQLGASLNNGVSVGTIGIAGTATVTFKVKLNELVEGAVIKNSFDTTMNYTIDPLIQNGGRSRKTSNIITTQINDAIIGRGPNSFLKTVDKQFAGLRDIVTYTIFLENKGNVPGTNIILKDNMPLGTTFIQDSVEINGTVIPGFSPAQGIVLGTINPSDKITIKFKVHIDTIPCPNIIRNQALLTYSYTKIPGYIDCEFATGTSNETEVVINHGEVLEALTPDSCGFTMNSDKCFARRGEVICYNCNIPNSGNVMIENVVFGSCIPEGTILIPDSVVVNGGVLLYADPSDGVKVGNINPGDPASVYFKVEVVSIPKDSVAITKGVVEYEYKIDTNKPAVKAVANSNTVVIPLGDAKIDCIDNGFIKTVDKKFAQIGDIVTYTLVLKNTGNIEAFDVLVVDNLAKGNKLIPGSVVINNVKYNSIDPNRGINISSIQANEVTTVSFKALVDTIPKDGRIKSVANIDYLYRHSPTDKPIDAKGTSNEVSINVRSVNLNFENFKASSDAEFAAVGDIITYSYDINNTGNINAENVLFKAKIEEGTIFVKDSALVNNYPSLGIDSERGIYIGGVQPGYPQKLSYQVKVIAIPKKNPIVNKATLYYESRVDERCSPIVGCVDSNIIFTEVKSSDLIITKDCNVKSTVVGETIEYKVKIINKGNKEVFNFTLSEQLPPELEFQQGSVNIDGNMDYLGDILSGVEVGVIYPNTYCIVTYKAKVVENSDTQTISSKAMASYEFIVDPNKSPRQEIKESNINVIHVESAELLVEKTADKKFVVLGDIINYSIMVENIGTISASDIMIIDKLSSQIDFIKNSLIVNGERINAIDIKRGINIGSLAPYKKVLIKYKTKVSRATTGCVIENQAYGIFNYRSGDGLNENSKSTEMVSVKINTASPTFKEINQDGILYVPIPKIAIQEVDIVNADAEILDYHVIRTMRGLSAENRRSTGYKLIINGLLTQNLEYTAVDALQSVHSSKFERKFSTFINLPEDYEEGSHIIVNARVEDINYHKLTEREVFTNITLFIEANNIC